MSLFNQEDFDLVESAKKADELPFQTPLRRKFSEDFDIDDDIFFTEKHIENKEGWHVLEKNPTTVTNENGTKSGMKLEITHEDFEGTLITADLTQREEQD